MTSLPKDIYLPETQTNAQGKAVLIVTANDVEDLEFFYPYYRFIEEGYKVDVATPDGGTFKGKHGLTLQSSKKIADVKEADYAMLYIPGGKAPAQLITNKEAVDLTKTFVKSGKPVGAICHGPQLLAKADVIKGTNISAFPEVEGEVKDAGATFTPKETLTSGQFTTARWPADLPAHMKAVLEALKSSGSSKTRPLAA